MMNLFFRRRPASGWSDITTYKQRDLQRLGEEYDTAHSNLGITRKDLLRTKDQLGHVKAKCASALAILRIENGSSTAQGLLQEALNDLDKEPESSPSDDLSLGLNDLLIRADRSLDSLWPSYFPPLEGIWRVYVASVMAGFAAILLQKDRGSKQREAVS